MEIWKDIDGYVDLYQISNIGRVKSLERVVVRMNGRPLTVRERILVPAFSGPEYRKYYCVNLSKNGKTKTTDVHRLVGKYFVDNPNNYPVLNHLDNDPLNNHWTNFEWTTKRTNSAHGWTFHKTTSQFTGVHWCKSRNKWTSAIHINGKSKHLGRFINEIDASNAYQSALSNLI